LENGMDIIFLGGLEISTIIGIYDWERETKQTVVLDIEMAFDIQKAAETDDIQYALDYKTVSHRIVSFIEDSQFFLVEKLISEIADIIRTEFNVSWVKIKLNKKGAIRGASDVGIIIERGEK
jgi:dihydroneopterin aldolase